MIYKVEIMYLDSVTLASLSSSGEMIDSWYDLYDIDNNDMGNVIPNDIYKRLQSGEIDYLVFRLKEF